MKRAFLFVFTLVLVACGNGGEHNPQSLNCEGSLPCLTNHAEDPDSYFVFNVDRPQDAEFYNFLVSLDSPDVVRLDFLWRHNGVQYGVHLRSLAYDCYGANFYAGYIDVGSSRWTVDEILGELHVCGEVLEIVELEIWTKEGSRFYLGNMEAAFIEKIY